MKGRRRVRKLRIKGYAKHCRVFATPDKKWVSKFAHRLQVKGARRFYGSQFRQVYGREDGTVTGIVSLRKTPKKGQQVFTKLPASKVQRMSKEAKARRKVARARNLAIHATIVARTQPRRPLVQPCAAAHKTKAQARAR